MLLVAKESILDPKNTSLLVMIKCSKNFVTDFGDAHPLRQAFVDTYKECHRQAFV